MNALQATIALVPQEKAGSYLHLLEHKQEEAATKIRSYFNGLLACFKKRGNGPKILCIQA